MLPVLNVLSMLLLFFFYLSGECTYYATIAAMESHFKAAYAVRPHDQEREFSVRLSTEHLKEMVEEHYAQKEGVALKGSQRLEICLKLAKLCGVIRPGPEFLLARGGTKKRGPITILGQMLTE